MAKFYLKHKIAMIFLGILLSLVIIEAGMRLTARILIYLQESENKISTSGGSQYSVLCLGESMTVWGGDMSWPSQLEEVLNDNDKGISFKVVNKGRHAIQSSYIVSILDDSIEKYNPGIVVVMMGVNDADNKIFSQPIDIDRWSLFISKLKLYRLLRIVFFSLDGYGKNILHTIRNMKTSVNLFFKYGRDKISRVVNSDCDLEYSAVLRQAKKHIEEKKYKQAEDILNRLLNAASKKTSEVYLYLGRCFREQARYKEALAMYEKSYAIDSENSWLYVEWGNLFKSQGLFEDAEIMYKKALKINPENNSVYSDLLLLYLDSGQYEKADNLVKNFSLDANILLVLGKNYRLKGEFEKAEQMLKHVLHVQPSCTVAYDELIRCYGEWKKIDEIKDVFKQAVAMDAAGTATYVEMSNFYREIGERTFQYDLLQEVLAKYPDCIDAGLYIYAGWCYKDEFRAIEEAEKMFKKAIELEPENAVPYIELIDIYRHKEDLKAQREIISKIDYVLKNTGNTGLVFYNTDRLYGILAIKFLLQGEKSLALKYFKKADNFRLHYRHKSTVYNYKLLKDKVLNRNIKLICVQYPLRDIDSLRSIFDCKEGIVFVENKINFFTAIASGNYEDYFEDNFAGDFGHCTPLGNRMIAENIADAIWNRVFEIR
ncbi:MAG: tetratricopeptide repeat protein [Candidatus Omnitrophica bacterium]|nr:tetratricopeptide repeat protein [Candidatus Omnitrophota bacterium]